MSLKSIENSVAFYRFSNKKHKGDDQTDQKNLKTKDTQNLRVSSLSVRNTTKKTKLRRKIMEQNNVKNIDEQHQQILEDDKAAEEIIEGISKVENNYEITKIHTLSFEERDISNDHSKVSRKAIEESITSNSLFRKTKMSEVETQRKQLGQQNPMFVKGMILTGRN